MSKEWKLVPVEPTYEMGVAGSKAFSFDVKTVYSAMIAAAPDNRCHGEKCTAGAWPNSAEHSKECLKEAAKSQGWSVPPAVGEVEVLTLFEQVIGKDPQAYLAGSTVYQVTEAEVLAFASAHVTHLTAERDALKAEVERLGELLAKEGRHFDAVWQKGLDLQSELTKALELLAKGQHYGPYLWNKTVGEFLVHQTAPAAKGGSDE